MTTDVRITADMLRDVGACEEGVDEAIAAFPELDDEGVEPTLDNLRMAHRVLRDDVFWLDDLLKREAWKVYEAGLKKAREVCRDIPKGAERVYDEACLAALAKAFEGLSNDDLSLEKKCDLST